MSVALRTKPPPPTFAYSSLDQFVLENGREWRVSADQRIGGFRCLPNWCFGNAFRLVRLDRQLPHRTMRGTTGPRPSSTKTWRGCGGREASNGLLHRLRALPGVLVRQSRRPVVCLFAAEAIMSVVLQARVKATGVKITGTVEQIEACEAYVNGFDGSFDEVDYAGETDVERSGDDSQRGRRTDVLGRERRHLRGVGIGTVRPKRL